MRMCGRLESQMGQRMNGGMDRSPNAATGEWIDGWIHGSIDRSTCIYGSLDGSIDQSDQSSLQCTANSKCTENSLMFAENRQSIVQNVQNVTNRIHRDQGPRPIGKPEIRTFRLPRGPGSVRFCRFIYRSPGQTQSHLISSPLGQNPTPLTGTFDH